jgi:hypothetical protein
MQRLFAITVLAAAVAAPAAAACPRPPRSIARPAALGIFPTPPGFHYVSAKRTKQTVVARFYANETLKQAVNAWYSVIPSTSFWRPSIAPQTGTHSTMKVTGTRDKSSGRVDFTVVCKNRVSVVLTLVNFTP